MQRRATHTPSVPVCLTSDTGETATGEVLEGDGQRVLVGLPGSSSLKVRVGASLGFELAQDESHRRLPVVLVATGSRDGVRTFEVELSHRALLGAGPGSTLSALFNERAAFRLPIQAGTIRGAFLRAFPGAPPLVSTGARGSQGGRGAASRPITARVLDASFDGLGVLVSCKAAPKLQGVEDVHVQFSSEQGLVTVEGRIRHRQTLPRGSGLRLGIAAGKSRSAVWSEGDEARLRKFVGEQQRATLARLRSA